MCYKRGKRIVMVSFDKVKEGDTKLVVLKNNEDVCVVEEEGATLPTLKEIGRSTLFSPFTQRMKNARVTAQPVVPDQGEEMPYVVEKKSDSLIEPKSQGEEIPYVVEKKSDSLVEPESQASVLTQNEKDIVFLTSLIEHHRQGTGLRQLIPAILNEIGAGCIVISKGEVLLILNNYSNLWGFPKGYAKTDDRHIYATALRELQEETGIKLDETHFLGRSIKRHNYYYFVVCLKDEERNSHPLSIQDTVEIQQAGWFNLEVIRTLPVMCHVKSILLPTL